MKKLLDLIGEHKWLQIYNGYMPEQIVKNLSFIANMRVAYQMFSNKEYDDNLYNFAVDLLQNIRKKYPQEWELDWRNDLFLGDACHFTMRYSESYEAYKRASLKFDSSNLPPSLLVSLAGCYLVPGESHISIEEAENLTRAALEKEKSIEAVVLIRGICKTQGREKEFFYWDKILEELERKGTYMRSEWPKW